VLPMLRQRALAAIQAGEPGRLTYHDWSMRPGENPADVNVWYACNPALGIRISEDYVAAELAALGPAKFSIERGGLWPDPAGANWTVIPKDAWRDAADPNSSLVDPVAFAVTLSTDRQWATIAAAGRRADGLSHIELVDRRQGTGWVIPRLVDLVARWKPCAVVIDKGSPASSLAAEAEEALIELTPIQTRDVAAAAGALYDGIAGSPALDPDTGELGRDPRVIRHRAQPDLTTAVAGAVKRSLSSQWAWDQLAAKVDITPLIACSNALWGFTTRVPVESHEPLVAWR